MVCGFWNRQGLKTHHSIRNKRYRQAPNLEQALAQFLNFSNCYFSILYFDKIQKQPILCVMLFSDSISLTCIFSWIKNNLSRTYSTVCSYWTPKLGPRFYVCTVHRFCIHYWKYRILVSFTARNSSWIGDNEMDLYEFLKISLRYTHT